MRTKSLYIDGQWLGGRGPVFTSVNPASAEVNWQGASANREDIAKAVRFARQAYASWSLLSLDERIKFLNEFARLLGEKRNDFAAIISRETGKPLWESLNEADIMINKVKISVEAHRDRCREVSGPMDTGLRITRFKPHGVIAVLGPFNLPGHLPNGHIVPALLAGNTIVFKPSELTPLVGERMVQIWEAAGLPKGVLNLVQGQKETGIALSQHPDIDGVFFTGSVEAGKAIHKFYAGRPEKILALEMGGNNPLIVADIQNTAAAVYFTILSAFITAGQRCSCARRLIVIKSPLTDKFLGALIEATRKIRVGPFTDQPEPFMGPVISKAVGQRLLAEQALLKKKGGRALVEMAAVENHRAMLRPGIMDVTKIKNRPDKEIFGPLLQLIRVKTFAEAVAQANNTAFGLAAGLLSDDEELYKSFLPRSRAGIVNWNRQLTGASSQAPFGGIGQSGNHQPSAFFAADYCSYPVACIEARDFKMPEKLLPGITL
jgi:succinylglutamic semialdehyde dehydrogenase